ncbi:MAG TPA: YggS family pyridoxal phosphate-dependent enzyme [Verrucomicrobiae bacterium]|jgi:pyridoxal phosphate enzyme (YggS family)|nr:YggS family pyridoxal phosphate-dependent enzyme [Verrucomicrobiae bacterium]
MSAKPAALVENLEWVRERISVAAVRAGRRAGEITLIAVSKTHSAGNIQQLYEAGVRHFGENRVQERESKLSQTTGLQADWHMIGHLQKNKAARAVQLFSSIDSVDSLAVAERLDRAPAESASRLRVLIEVKLDPEPAKSGAVAQELPPLVAAISRLPHLELRGLMGIPPYFDNPEEARPFFRHLRELRDALRAEMGPEALPVLSMGMSHDFEIAIEEGATEIRVGTALFGARGEP